MDGSYLTNPLAFLVQVLLGLYALVVVLRFFMVQDLLRVLSIIQVKQAILMMKM